MQDVIIIRLTYLSPTFEESRISENKVVYSAYSL